MSSEKRCLDAVPVLRAADYPRSRDFYTKVLGYSIIEEGGEPPRFGIFRREGSLIYVDAWLGGPASEQKGWNIYVHVTDLEGLLEEFRTAGAEITRQIEVTAYGMREFELKDPDGNTICFGIDASK